MAGRSQLESGVWTNSELLLLFSEVHAARLLGVSRTTFRRWVVAGLLHPVSLPGGVKRKLYHRDDILAFAESLRARGRYLPR